MAPTASSWTCVTCLEAKSLTRSLPTLWYKALLAVIGPNWMNLMSARMAAGGKDLMREEIATALERNLIIIPVLIERSPLPGADSLPDDIRALVAREAEEVRFKYFDRDMENITAAIDARREERARKAIKNSEQLWLWLKERPIEVSRAIAARAALRALPLGLRYSGTPRTEACSGPRATGDVRTSRPKPIAGRSRV
jgi:hypothetical protein